MREHLRRLERFSGCKSDEVPVKFITSWVTATAVAYEVDWNDVYEADWNDVYVADWNDACNAAYAAACGISDSTGRRAGYTASYSVAWRIAYNAGRGAIRNVGSGAAHAAVYAAAYHVARAASYRAVADLAGWPSPWEPLLDVYRLGYWPIGVPSRAFVVFEPDIAQ